MSSNWAAPAFGFYQEYRASAAVDGLKRRLALTCRVTRGGIETTLPTSTIVRGDIAILAAGNLVPADGLATPYLGSLSAALGFVPLSAAKIATAIVMVIGYVVATEVAKMWFYRKIDVRPPAVDAHQGSRPAFIVDWGHHGTRQAVDAPTRSLPACRSGSRRKCPRPTT